VEASVLAPAVCEYDFGRLGPVKSEIIVLRPPLYMIQFCRPRVGINSWNYDVHVIGILEHQISRNNCGEICCIDYIRRWAGGRSFRYAG